MESEEAVRARLFGKVKEKVEEKLFECINCHKKKKKFGQYCNPTCYYEANA